MKKRVYGGTNYLELAIDLCKANLGRVLESAISLSETFHFNKLYIIMQE